MRFHWQNLNDSVTKPRRGGGRRHGRAWLTLFEREESPRRSGVSVKWCWTILWDASCAVAFTLVRQEGHGISVRLALPWLFDFYLTLLGGPFAWVARKLLPELKKDQRPSYAGQKLPIRDYGDREVFNLYFYAWAFWWNFWHDPMGGWSSRDPKWQQGSFHVVDFVFGSTKYEARAIEGPVAVKIGLPERAYDATVTIEERIWRRKRWPGVWRRWLGHDVDCKQDPLPFPGKGENSWDCGEDAVYGHSGPSQSAKVSEAIGSVVESVMESRHRHGGLGWLPKEDHRPKPSNGGTPPTADAQAAS